MLRTRVRCRAVLALTATATVGTAAAVAHVLDIPPDGVIRDDSVRSNLRMSVVHANGGASHINKPSRNVLAGHHASLGQI